MQHVLVQIIILSLFLMTRLKPEVLNNKTVKSIKNHIPFLGRVCMPEKHFLKVSIFLCQQPFRDSVLLLLPSYMYTWSTTLQEKETVGYLMNILRTVDLTKP